MQQRNQSFYYTVLLISIIVIVFVSNVLWIVLDHHSLLEESAEVIQRSALFSEYLARLQFQAIFFFTASYPPLVPTITGFFVLLFGNHEDIFQFSLVLWVVLLMLSTYSIAYRLFKHEIAAIFAASILLLYPFVAHFGRIFSLDFPLAALITASFAALIKAEYFYNRKWSILFALCAAAALLTQWTAIIFLFGPCLYFAILSMVNANKESEWKRAVFHILLSLGIISFLAGPWYVLHSATVLSSIRAMLNTFISDSNAVIVDWNYYFQQSLNGMGWIMGIFLCIGLLSLIRYRERSIWFLFIWISFPFLVFTYAFSTKDAQFFLPVFPAFAIITSGLFIRMKHQWRTISMVTILCVGLFFWFETSWGIQLLPHNSYKQLFIEYQYGYTQETLSAPKNK